MARLGLDQLTRGRHTAGLQALIDASGLTGKKIGSYEVGFMLAPRVNAAGRMATPDLATRLLLAVDESQADEARHLAERLDAENTRRRDEEAEILKQARRVIAADPDIGAQNMLVVLGRGVAPRRDRDRRLQAGRSVLPPSPGPLNGGGRGAWLGTEHPGIRPTWRHRTVPQPL